MEALKWHPPGHIDAHVSRQLLSFCFSPFFGRSGGAPNPVGLPFRSQRPYHPRRLVGERHRDQLLRLACQHPGQRRIRGPAVSACVPYHRHGSRDQEPSQVSLAHHRCPGAASTAVATTIRPVPIGGPRRPSHPRGRRRRLRPGVRRQFAPPRPGRVDAHHEVPGGRARRRRERPRPQRLHPGAPCRRPRRLTR